MGGGEAEGGDEEGMKTWFRIGYVDRCVITGGHPDYVNKIELIIDLVLIESRIYGH